MNKVRFFAVALVFTLIAAISLWLVWSPNEHQSKSPEKQTDTVNASDADQSPGLVARGNPGVALNSVVSSVDDDALIALVYGPTASNFVARGKIFLANDFNQGGKLKHIFVSSAGPEAKGQSKYTALVLVQSGAIWLVESKTERPCQLTTDVRWKRIGPQNFALIEKTKTITDRNVTVQLGIYALAGQSAQPLLEISKTGKKGDALDIRIGFKKSDKSIWSVNVVTLLNNERAVREHYFYRYGAYVSKGSVPPLSRLEVHKVRGPEPSGDDAE